MMKTLYLQCNMGAAGDMLLAALYELLPDREAFLARLNGLGLPGVRVRKRSVCGDVTVKGAIHYLLSESPCPHIFMLCFTQKVPETLNFRDSFMSCLISD